MMFLIADWQYSHKNYRPTGLCLGTFLRVVHNREPTQFKLTIDLGLECFQAEGWGFDRNSHCEQDHLKFSQLESQLIKSMRCKFLQDIYLENFIIF